MYYLVYVDLLTDNITIVAKSRNKKQLEDLNETYGNCYEIMRKHEF